MAKPSSAKKPRVVLFTLDDVPVGRRLREAIPASDLVRTCAHLVYLNEHEPLAKMLEAVPEPDLEDGVADDILAVDEAIAQLVRPEALLGTDEEMINGFHPGVDVPRAAKLLARGGFEVVLYADAMRRRLTPHGRNAFLAGVIAAFETSISTGPARKAILAFLRGETKAAPGAALRDAERANDDSVSEVCQTALGPDVERWDPEVSGRVLDLWVAARSPSDRLSFDDGEDELGADRQGLLTTALEARGVHPAQAFLCGAAWPSRTFLAVSRLPQGSALLASAVAFDASSAEGDEPTAPDIAYALFNVGEALAKSPLVQRYALALLTSAETPPAALGAQVLWRAVETFGKPMAKKITSAHLAAVVASNSSGSTNSLFDLATNLVQHAPKVHGGALRAVTEGWLAGANAMSSNLLAMLANRTKEAEVVWPHVVRLLSLDPENAAVYRNELLPVLRKLGAPPAEAKKQLAALCAKKAKALGPLLAGLSKIAGVKSAPLPYSVADLESLPAPLAKAFQKAREQSWEAGAKLPKGASAKAIAAVEKALGVPLPDDFRAFYLLHDGAGDWEVRPGHTLLGLSDCLRELEANKTLVEEDGDEEATKVKGDFFNARWLPFTTDHGGNSYCIDLDPPRPSGRGQVIFFDHEDEVREVEAKSFLAFLTKVP